METQTHEQRYRAVLNRNVSQRTAPTHATDDHLLTSVRGTYPALQVYEQTSALAESFFGGPMRTSIKTILLAPALVLAAACSKDKPVDASLSNDLTLAAQARQTATMDSISAAERTNAAAAANATALRQPVASAPRRTTATTTRRRSTSSSGSTSSGSTRSAPAEQRTVTVKNTKRDAAIGAAAGAIIGATTSRDKVKGGLIGAAAGGILGAVIGNNVDVKKKPVP